MNIGTVISGTMREEDLIPSLLDELISQHNNDSEVCPNHTKLIKEIEYNITQKDYYNSPDSSWDLESLFDALCLYAPPYFYFGAHYGDGSDYGYWVYPFFNDDFDGLKVDDLSKVPEGYSGEVLVVNDHGNMTLYRPKVEYKEVWSIV